LKNVIISVLCIVLTLGIAGSAFATNAQNDDNKTNTQQSGSDTSGTANAGQISGVVSSGTTSADATNSTDHADVTSGDARSNNDASTFTGLDASNATGTNIQRGDNKTWLSQDAEVVSGNASDGQIIGIVTSFGGTTDVVGANTSSFNDVTSGRAKSTNDATTFTGLQALLSDTSTATNIQRGDNKVSVTQTNPTTTGNAMSGQVIGVNSSGATTVDGTNLSAHNDVDTVAAFGANSVDAITGLVANATDTGVAINIQRGDNTSSFSQDAPGTSNSATTFVGLNSNADAASSTNVQRGDNKLGSSQDSPVAAASYDSIAGQVIADTTATGGSADLVLANTSTWNDIHVVGVAGQVAGVVSGGATSVDATNLSDHNDVEGGVTYASTSLDAFVGLDAISSLVVPTAFNLQQGDNKSFSSQSSSAISGEPVAGQIIGVVTDAGGSNSVVLDNASTHSDVESVTARDAESLSEFIGLLAASETAV
jgi:hypothetical protein